VQYEELGLRFVGLPGRSAAAAPGNEP
jgi:hypothetical protein